MNPLYHNPQPSHRLIKREEAFSDLRERDFSAAAMDEDDSGSCTDGFDFPKTMGWMQF